MSKHSIATAQCAAAVNYHNKEAVIADIASRIASATSLPVETVQRCLQKREALGSTGLEKGIALPHCGIAEAQNFVVGVVTAATPVDFGALDGQPSDIFVFVAGPEGKRTEHVRILAALTAQLRDESVRRNLRSADSGDELARILHSALLPAEHEETGQFSLLLLYVQNQGLYEPVLEAVSGETDASVSVSSSQSAGAILHRLPLFATFWNETDTREIHRIEVVLPRDRVNRTIRRVEEITGRQEGVQLSVLDLSYGSGSLDL
jgi:PTS system nitrogen regulatory IIA component